MVETYPISKLFGYCSLKSVLNIKPEAQCLNILLYFMYLAFTFGAFQNQGGVETLERIFQKTVILL